jgi:hypothetical protein
MMDRNENQRVFADENFDKEFDQLQQSAVPRAAARVYDHDVLAREFAATEESNMRHARNNR